MKYTIALILVFNAVSIAIAAPATSPSEAVRNAIASTLRNNASAAEEALVPAIVASPGSAAWHMEMSVMLMRVVHDTQQEGRSSVLPNLVTSAAAHLAQADAKASNSSERAHTKALTGLLNERYTGNLSLAASSYRAAAQLDPKHPHAKKAAERLEKSEENLRQRLLARGGQK